ncbi:MAG: crossover junction endodeoxyribonuclease RuvC [Oligoflexus sp.]
MAYIKVLGIDPGSHITGFCILACPKRGGFQMGHLKILDAGSIQPKKNLCHSERAGQLHNSLYSLAAYHQPDICVIEKAFTGVNPMSALRLGETRGALISAARRLNIHVEEIAATQVKKTISGQGHATKEQIARALEVMIGFHRGSLPYDVTDAVAIAVSFGMLWPVRQLSGNPTKDKFLKQIFTQTAEQPKTIQLMEEEKR